MRMFYTCVLKRCMQDILRRARSYACVQNTYSDEYMFSAKDEEAVVLRVVLMCVLKRCDDICAM